MFREVKKIIRNPMMIMAGIAMILFLLLQSFFVLRSPGYASFSENLTKLNQDYQQGILTEDTDLITYCNQFQNDPNKVYETAAEKLSMHSYLKNELESISDKMDLPMFSDEQKDLKKKYTLLSKQEDISITFPNDMVFRSFQKTDLCLDLLILLAGMGACYTLFITDIETDSLQLFASSKTGIYKLCIQKGSALFLYTASLFLIKFLIESTILKLTGLDMGLPIQMVSEGSHFLGMISIFQHLCFTTIGSLLCILFMIGLFFLMYIVSRSISFSILITTMFLLLEYLAEAIISLGSNFVFFKKYNIVHILQAFTTLSSDSSLEKNITWITAIGIGVIIITILSFLAYTNLKEVRHTTKLSIDIHAGLRLYQVIDCTVIKKYIWIFIFLLGYIAFDIQQYNTVKNPETIAVEQMRAQYYGPITSEKLDTLEEKMNAVTAAQEEVTAMTDAYIKNELSAEETKHYEDAVSKAMNYDAFMKVYSEITEVADHGGSYYIDNQGTKLWLQTESSLYRTVTFFLIAVPVLLFAGIAGERLYKGDIAMLADTSYNRKKYRKNAALLTILNIMIVILVVYGGRWMKFAKYYPIELNGPVSTHLSVSSNIPILAYLFMFFTTLFLLFVNMALCTMQVEKKLTFMQTIIGSLCICFALYVLPIGLQTILVHSKYSVIILSVCIPIFLLLARSQYIHIVKDHI